MAGFSAFATHSDDMMAIVSDIEKKIEQADKKNGSEEIKRFLSKNLNNANMLLQKIRKEEEKDNKNTKLIKVLVAEFEKEKKEITQKMEKIRKRQNPSGGTTFPRSNKPNSYTGENINCPKGRIKRKIFTEEEE
ncbi:MAG: hypothetical protein LBI26_01570 [Holosporales bacterium]|nr:hypothetical protein [Holosporales bacterium]